MMQMFPEVWLSLSEQRCLWFTDGDIKWRANRRKLSLMTTFKYVDDAKPHHVCPVGHSLLWQPLLEWSPPTWSRRKGLRVPLQGREDTADTHERQHLNREVTDYPLWWEGLSQNNESKSNERQITPLTLCFSSSLISNQTLHHFSTQTHNFTISVHKADEILIGHFF